MRQAHDRCASGREHLVDRRPHALRSGDQDLHQDQGSADQYQIWPSVAIPSASSYYRDVMGKLDPASGRVVEYPMPYADNGMRDFFVDRDGRMWFGSPPNNRVGYFYLSNRQRSDRLPPALPHLSVTR
jgi:hypothetical protein